mmetsp:Transcript_13339/g.32616  ORF Transcript_13339/g.32616 Transcript_13339/m.32616 type:complete len:624 (+) Transcript_13339:3-1874(+)
MVHEIVDEIERPRMDIEEKEVRNSAASDDLDDGDDRRVVLLFYKYFQNVKFVDAVNSVERLSSHQKQFCTQHNLKGRILIATEGVNGTLSGRRADIDAYIKSCEQYQEEVVVVVANDGIDAQNQENRNDASNGNSSKEMKLLFQSVDWKYSDIPKTDQGVYDQEPFPDLKVSIVKEIVSTGGLISVDDLTETGNHLTPEEFHETLSKSQEDGNKKIVLVDVRNTFEHNIGHFTNPSAGGEKAMNPEMVTFSSFDKFCNDNKDKLQDHKVLMYCTGGIRCEKASVMMKRKGIQDVNQLSGGIHRYLEKYGSDGHFKGLNFTFDKRVAVKPTATPVTTTTTNDSSTESASASSATYEVVGRCLECQNPFDELCGSRVCSVCRDLVLVCPKCREGLREYHCERHSEWKSCYFTFLEYFDRDELLAQKIELLSIRDMKYAPTPSCKHKNIRRTLSRQTEKLEQQIRWMDGNNRTKGVKDAPRRCRTCMEPSTVCDGRCWGFWKTDGSRNKVENDNNDGSTGTPQNNPILPIAVGDRVEPGKDWNPIRLGDTTDPSSSSSSSPLGSLRKGVVVEIKSWAGSEKDCVAVLWDDMTGIKSRNSGKIQPQIYRFGVLACDGRTRLYDVCKI